jgi:hypothetical protein
MRKGHRGGERGNQILELSDAMMEWAILFAAAAGVGIALHLAIRGMRLRWSWAVPVLVLGAVLALASTRAGVLAAGGAAVALTIGVAWHRHELERGGIEAQRERDRVGPLSLVRTRLAIRTARLDRTCGDRFALGQTPSGRVPGKT